MKTVSMLKELDSLATRLVWQMNGRKVTDTQDGDYQIAYFCLCKALELTAKKTSIMKKTKEVKEEIDIYQRLEHLEQYRYELISSEVPTRVKEEIIKTVLNER